jgi:integrator complex subunit 2
MAFRMQNFRLAQEFYLLWEKAFCVKSSEIGLATVNILRQKEERRGGDLSENPLFSDADLVNDPLIVLRCDPRTFTSPILVQIILQVLDSYMIASRTSLNRQAQASPSGSIKRTQLANLVHLQDSTILQILLEVTQLTLSGEQEEINALICGFLHAQFIKNPILVKLIHFQTYPINLIPILVEGVPSIHLCLEFVGELMSQPEPEKQLFAVHLGTELVRKYPLVSSVELARRILNHLRLVSSSARSVQFLRESLPCLVNLCASLPIMAEPACQLLLDLRADDPYQDKVPSLAVRVSCREARSDGPLQDVVERLFSTLSTQIFIK